MLEGLTIARATSAERDEVAAFYHRVGYRAPVGDGDVVLLARREGTIAGAVRLAEENDVLVLRGLWVDPALRRRGIAARLLEQAKLEIDDRPCWTVPHRHLAPLFRRIGFREVPALTAPAFLTERATRDPELGGDVVVMHRTGVTHPTDRIPG